MAGRHVVVEDDCGGNLVYELFVAACHAAEATVDHGAVGKCRRKPLVVALYRHIWHLSMQLL